MRALAALLCGVGIGCAAEIPTADSTFHIGPAARAAASLGAAAREDASAAAAPAGELTLERAVRIALEHNHALAMARTEREIAEGQIVEARSSALPTIGLRGTYTRLHEVASFGGPPPAPSMDLGALDNTAVVVTLRQPLYQGGRAWAATRLARAHRRAVEHTVDGTTQAIVLAVHRGFYDVLLAEEDLKAAAEALELSRRHLEDVTRRLEHGMATRFEVTRAEVRQEMAGTSAIRARNAVALARTSLFTLLGVPLDAPLTIAGTLEFAPRAGAGGGEEAFETALRHRPDLAAQEGHIAMQRENITIVRADGRPNVQLTGEAGWEDPSQHSFGSLDDDTYWHAGVVVTMTLFDGLRLNGRLRQEKARLAQLQTARAKLIDQIRLEVAQSRLTLENARKLVASQAKALEQAREALRLAQAGYEQGVGTQLDVLDAQLGLTEARRGHARAVYSYLMASVALERATGTLVTAPRKGDVR
jgi:TolC family type I secretion outer membrane protein